MAQAHIDKEVLRHDAFRDGMFSLIGIAHQRRKELIIAGVALVVAAAAALGYYTFLQRQIAEQSAAFAVAERVLGDTKLSPEDRIKEAQKALERFVEDHPSARLTPLALTYLGRFAMQEKRYDAAEAAWQKALAHGRLDPSLRILLLVALGKVREAQAKPGEAQAFYDQIADKHAEDLRTYLSGVAALAAGKPEDARKHFAIAAAAQPPTSISAWAKDALDYLP